MSTRETQLTLTEVEESLAESRPFGDSEYINDCTWRRYTHRLRQLSEFLPVAQRVLSGLGNAVRESKFRILGDPLVRSAINRALAHFRLAQTYEPLDELTTILETTASELARNAICPPLHGGTNQAIRLGPSLHHGWIWCDDRDGDFGTKSFRKLFNQYLGGTGLKLACPSKDVINTLVEGAEFLDALLPKLSRSALSHVQLIAIVDHPPGFASVTNPSIPGSIFLSRSVLRTPWKAAEYLLHEGLHQKFVDLEHTHSLAHRATDERSRHLISPPWRRSFSNSPNSWPIKRSLTAFHVYVALALFFRSIETKGSIRGLNASFLARRSFDRAHYLADAIAQASQELGPAGTAFLEWLTKLTEAFDPAPPRLGSYLHLTLDLYERETFEIGALLADDHFMDVPPEPRAEDIEHKSRVTDTMNTILRNDLSATRTILLTLGLSEPWLGPVGAQPEIEANSSTCTRAGRWWGTRSLIAQALKRLPEDANVLAGEAPSRKTVGEFVYGMVEDSGSCFEDLLSELRRQ
jgi:hypothetical protein